MKAIKVFNNNSVSTIMPDGREAVVVGSGVGFGKRPNDEIDSSRIEKIYYIQNELQTKFLQLLNDTNPKYLTVSEEILAKAEEDGLKLRNQVLITLTDHISFAVERLENGIELPNLMLTEVKLLYPMQYQIGVWALERIKKTCGISLPMDEVGYIALHLVNASVTSENAYETLKFVNGAMQIVKDSYGIEFDEDDIDTMRLRTHLKFLAGRIFSNTPWETDELSEEMYQMLLNSNRKNKECLHAIDKFIREKFNYNINEQECMYLLIHFTKVTQNKKKHHKNK
jgi:beta-glucoside operon transcriptional antiterminator